MPLKRYERTLGFQDIVVDMLVDSFEDSMPINAKIACCMQVLADLNETLGPTNDLTQLDDSCIKIAEVLASTSKSVVEQICKNTGRPNPEDFKLKL